MPNSKIAVIESRWWPGYNCSIRDQFDLLFEMHYDDRHAYEYEMVGTASALEEAIRRLSRSEGVDVLYIGTHGTSRGLNFHGNRRGGGAENVGGRALADMICAANRRNKVGISGIYVKACDFGSRTIAETLLNTVPRLTWVAGFGAKVDIVESGAIDTLFFCDWLRRRGDPDKKIRKTSDYLRNNILGLCDNKNFKFSIFARSADGPVIDLLRT